MLTTLAGRFLPFCGGYFLQAGPAASAGGRPTFRAPHPQPCPPRPGPPSRSELIWRRRESKAIFRYIFDLISEDLQIEPEMLLGRGPAWGPPGLGAGVSPDDSRPLHRLPCAPA